MNNNWFDLKYTKLRNGIAYTNLYYDNTTNMLTNDKTHFPVMLYTRTSEWFVPMVETWFILPKHFQTLLNKITP